MIASLTALVITLAATGIGTAAVPTSDELHGELNEDTDKVDVIGRHQRTWSPEPVTSPGLDSSTQQAPPHVSPGGDTNESEPCIPRIRTIDGVDQPGHVCPDDSNGLIWVPDTDADPENPGAAQVPPLVVTSEEVQTLLVDAGTIQVQPDRSWVLVNAETIVHTDAAEHVLNTQVLGINVDVRATPVQFTWDFGDGSQPLTRTEPGAPWPDHTTAHKYQTTGDYAVTLRTQWDAHFRVQGASTWRPVTGTPVTVATSEPFEAVTAIPRLTR